MQLIDDILKADLDTLNQIIQNDLTSQVSLINQIGYYIIASGGKRIRPKLTLIAGKMLGYNEGTLLHKMAAMIEYIHTATLLHDDVVDKSDMRRGKETVNNIFGNAASVLVGDFIYSRAFQLMTNAKSLPLLELMAKSTNQIAEGEVLQLLSIGNSNLNEDDYYNVIKSKTSVLFEAAVKVASIVANNFDVELEQALIDYAVNLGISFQITDDILDYLGNPEEMGKNVGDDLLEGKITLPLIYILNKGSMIEQELIKNAIKNPQTIVINDILSIINNSESLNYCRKCAQTYTLKSLQALEKFPNSTYKDSLIDLANFAMNRVS